MSCCGGTDANFKINVTRRYDGLISRDQHRIPVGDITTAEPIAGRVILNAANLFFYYADGTQWLAGCCPGGDPA